MQKLLDGVRRFHSVTSARYRTLFRRLAEDGQRPHTLFITCADSRVVAELVTDSQPGELFVVKNIGNIVPPASLSNRVNSTAAAIEFAVEELAVQNLVVCGHSHCGAVAALRRETADLDRLPHLAAWLHLAAPVRQFLHARLQSGAPPDECLRAAERQNVLCSLDNLRTFPAVQNRLAAGALALHGWHFDIATSRLHQFDAASGQFVPLAPETAAA